MHASEQLPVVLLSELYLHSQTSRHSLLPIQTYRQTSNISYTLYNKMLITQM